MCRASKRACRCTSIPIVVFSFRNGWMKLSVLALLVRHQDLLAAFVIEQHGAIVVPPEVRRPDTSAVDQRERQPIGEKGPEFLDQVESKPRSPRSISVQTSHLEVEADTFERARLVVDKQRVKERQQRIYAIKGRATTAVLESKLALAS